MKEYLSIGEVSKLKGVSIKSLRYYDQLNILKPAYINEQSGYRYYTLDQMVVLDVIIMCVDLGIPLKNFSNYADEQGRLRLDKILEDGQQIAMLKARKIQSALSRMERLSGSIRDYQAYKHNKGIYQRQIGKRNMLTAPWHGNPEDNKLFMKNVSELYLLSLELGLTSLYQQGLIYFYRQDAVEKYVFVEIMEESGDLRVISLPAREYSCTLLPSSQIEETAEIFGYDRAELAGSYVIDVDLYDANVEGDTYPVELQLALPFSG
ncbi:MerR family transcriptional regulator [Paenibacillus sp. PK3_47]|uniref:MerR family transcriptional regulator n=1 Tax=Paenibacillus sp. PK3_47 TaxID=2072642 RepID=UPI00218BE23F|nr:MerR family transcriptional regulator [Paenibacillus sp. PK3_47]UQZ36721.1 MerR family transcriptional regulator [Paenibacillus sp. PK3_47]